MRELSGRLAGNEQVLYIMCPEIANELKLSLATAEMIREEACALLTINFHYIEGWICITVADATDHDHAEQCLKFYLQTLGVAVVRVLV